MTPEQRARLAALIAQSTRTPAEDTELSTLAISAASETPAAPVTAATPPTAVTAPPATAPVGVPAPVRAAAQVNEPAPLQRVANTISAMMCGDRGSITAAAMADVTHTQHTDNVSPESWSGQLWSGLAYTPQFMDLFNQGSLTSWSGKGWRFTTKPQVGDYAGDKTDIPTNTPVTEPSTYEAFRLAGGWDIDRKFFDFPDSEFIAAFLEAAREDYAYKLDMKVKDYLVAQAVVPTVVPALDPQTTLIKAAGKAIKFVKRNTRAAATFVLVNDDDLDSLLDVTDEQVPAFLDLFGIDPKNFRSSDAIAAGTVYAGVKQAATVRQLPGASPLRVELQNLQKGGIDEAIFGYGAIEEHHTKGIVKVSFDPTFTPA